jgi:hypothetical protein
VSVADVESRPRRHASRRSSADGIAQRDRSDGDGRTRRDTVARSGYFMLETVVSTDMCLIGRPDTLIHFLKADIERASAGLNP